MMPRNESGFQAKAGVGIENADPLALFLSDPESHLSDVLYLYFRIYKKKLLWRFMRTALAELNLNESQNLFVADIGASMGFDVLYLLRKLTQNFGRPLRWNKVFLSLIEGDLELIAAGGRPGFV